MNQKEFNKIKVGDRLQFVPNQTTLIQAYGAENVPHILTNPPVTKLDFGNNRVYIKAPTNTTSGYTAQDWWVQPEWVLNVLPTTTKTKKPSRFSKSDVVEFARLGSNDKLKSEMATRLNSARNHLFAAIKPEDFNKEMRNVSEQLRQAKLIRAAIK